MPKAGLRYILSEFVKEPLIRTLGLFGASSKPNLLRPVILLSLKGQSQTHEGTINSLRQAGIKAAGPVRALERSGSGIRTVIGGEFQTFDVIYPALGCSVRSELAIELGAEANDVGCLDVNAHQQTTSRGSTPQATSFQISIRLPSQMVRRLSLQPTFTNLCELTFESDVRIGDRRPSSRK
jgi:hypothetical protein